MKSRCLLITILMFFVCSVFSSFADTAKPKQILTKADLPDGYYLGYSARKMSKNRVLHHSELWTTLSPKQKNYYIQKYGSLVKAPPASFISLEQYHYENGMAGKMIQYHKGPSANPGWKDTTPAGKKYGSKCCSIIQPFDNGDKLIIILFIKGDDLFLLKTCERAKSPRELKPDPEKLIETIYSRL
ncbi:MAG: hypothetical protein LWY06_02535 [Firmicutes bacterium]|nr:hypothetical protein [Bacillota bacterium]